MNGDAGGDSSRPADIAVTATRIDPSLGARIGDLGAGIKVGGAAGPTILRNLLDLQINTGISNKKAKKLLEEWLEDNPQYKESVEAEQKKQSENQNVSGESPLPSIGEQIKNVVIGSQEGKGDLGPNPDNRLFGRGIPSTGGGINRLNVGRTVENIEDLTNNIGIGSLINSQTAQGNNPQGNNPPFENPIDFDDRRPFPSYDPWSPGHRITYPPFPPGYLQRIIDDIRSQTNDGDNSSGGEPPPSGGEPPVSGGDDNMGNNFFDSYQQAEEQLNARDDLGEEEKTTILGILERLFGDGRSVARNMIDILLGGIRRGSGTSTGGGETPSTGSDGGTSSTGSDGETPRPDANGNCPAGYKKETINLDDVGGGTAEVCVPDGTSTSGEEGEGSPKPDASGNCPPGFTGVDTNGDGINDVCYPDSMGILALLELGAGMAGRNKPGGPSDLQTASEQASTGVFNDPTNFMRFQPTALQMIDPRYYNLTSFVPAGEQRDFNLGYERLPGQLYANRAPEEARTAAQGGLMQLAAGGFSRMNGQIAGPGTETSDDIPAMLSDGEFVVNAKAVRGIGNLMGQKKPKNALDSRRKGAQAMYALQNAGEKAAGLRR